MRLLEPPDARADGAGEGAAHVAEQLGLQQRLGNRAAVERHERAASPQAVVVNRAGHQLLARACLAGDEHGAVGHRHGLEQLEEIAHRPAAADDPGEAVAAFELRPEVGVLGPQPPLLERRLECVEQLVELERLGDEIRGAALDCLDRILHRAVSGDHDADNVGVSRNRGLEHLAAIDAGQAEIRDDDIEGELGQPLDGLFAVGGFDHEVAAVRQPLGHHLAQRRLVFDDEQMFSGIRHLVGRQHFDTGRQPREDRSGPTFYSLPRMRPIDRANSFLSPRGRKPWQQPPIEAFTIQDLSELFHRLNNELALILSHAELLEAKCDGDKNRTARGKANASFAAFISGYLSLVLAAVVTATELGIQPLIASTADGKALYCPYGLSVAIPAMAIGHMLVFGIIEGMLTALILNYFLINEPGMIYTYKEGS